MRSNSLPNHLFSLSGKASWTQAGLVWTLWSVDNALAPLPSWAPISWESTVALEKWVTKLLFWSIFGHYLKSGEPAAWELWGFRRRQGSEEEDGQCGARTITEQSNSGPGIPRQSPRQGRDSGIPIKERLAPFCFPKENCVLVGFRALN